MKSLDDFKAACKPGAQFRYRRIGQGPWHEKTRTVACLRPHAVVFVPDHSPLAAEQVAARPTARGLWFRYPPANRCRFERGELIVIDEQGRDYAAYREVTPD